MAAAAAAAAEPTSRGNAEENFKWASLEDPAFADADDVAEADVNAADFPLDTAAACCCSAKAAAAAAAAAEDFFKREDELLPPPPVPLMLSAGVADDLVEVIVGTVPVAVDVEAAVVTAFKAPPLSKSADTTLAAFEAADVLRLGVVVATLFAFEVFDILLPWAVLLTAGDVLVEVIAEAADPAEAAVADEVLELLLLLVLLLLFTFILIFELLVFA